MAKKNAHHHHLGISGYYSKDKQVTKLEEEAKRECEKQFIVWHKKDVMLFAPLLMYWITLNIDEEDLVHDLRAPQHNMSMPNVQSLPRHQPKSPGPQAQSPRPQA